MAEKAPLKHFNGVSQFIKIQVLSQYDRALSSNISRGPSMSTPVKFLLSKYTI